MLTLEELIMLVGGVMFGAILANFLLLSKGEKDIDKVVNDLVGMVARYLILIVAVCVYLLVR